MKKIAVVLSGCGFQDGSEICESVLTLLAIEQNGAEFQCIAPKIQQSKVVNHKSMAQDNISRDVLTESARIARGNILDINDAKNDDFDGLIFPGGFGAACNLSDFASRGKDMKVNTAVLTFAKGFFKANKPMGFICIAPSLMPAIYGAGIKLTIGNDVQTANTLEAMGAKHQDCPVDDVVIDEAHRAVSTPAYMLGPSVSDVAKGIHKLVVQVLSWA